MIADKIIKKANSYEIISFDIYDTLVKRNLSNHEKLFDFVENEYNLRHTKDTITNFGNARIDAEKAAKEVDPSRYITIDDIYQKLDESFISKEKLKSIEMEFEVKFSEPNMSIKKAYDNLVSENKRVILISDTYLPMYVIEKILQKCGIVGYEKIYLPSDVGFRKNDGRFFEYIIKDLGVKPKKIIHLGGMKRIDNIIPRIKGIRSIYLDDTYKNTNFINRKDIKESQFQLFSYINNQLPKYEDESKYTLWGYEAFGPMILGFCYWIHHMVQEHKIESLFFMSRDMYLVERIYRFIYEDEACKITYLEASRRSMRIAYVRQKGSMEAIFDTMRRDPYTAEEILEAIGLNYNDIRAINLDVDMPFTPKTLIYQKGSGITDGFRKFDEIVFPIICQQEDHCLDYLEQKGLFDESIKAIVDIGWHGTIQNMLEELVGNKLIGLYFGISKRNTFREMDLHGYWFNFKKEKDYEPYESMIYLLETVLFPEIGTTIEYKACGDKYVPIYGNYENKGFSNLKQFQKGAIEFSKDYYSFWGTCIENREIALFSFLKLCFSPTKEQALFFSNLCYEDGRMNRLAKSESCSFYLFHPKKFFDDYDSVRWKEGFLKLSLPYVRKPHEFYIKARRTKNRLKAFWRAVKN